MKLTIIPIVIDALGTMPKGLVSGLEKLEIVRPDEAIQTTILLTSTRILSPGDLRRLAVTQSSVKAYQLRLV